MMHAHTSDGTDDTGRGLTLTIRIGPDGSVYLHDIPPDLIPVALALKPDDPELLRRCDAAAAYRQENLL